MMSWEQKFWKKGQNKTSAACRGVTPKGVKHIFVFYISFDRFLRKLLMLMR